MLKQKTKIFLLGLLMFVQSKPVNDKVLNKNLDNYFQLLTDQKEFSGSVLVSQKGKILLKKSYGMANYEHGVPNTSETKFRIASITKQFTALAILILEERSLLNLQDPISKFIPDFPNGDSITIYHLLTHSSGIANYTSFPEYWQASMIQMPHEETIRRFKDKPINFLPGQKVEYNNTGYVLLACIVEQVTKKPFITFLKEEFFDPIGMHNTGFASKKNLIENHASGYICEKNTLTHADNIDMMQQSGAGCLYSTVEDLFLWHQALQNKKIISGKITDQMSIPQFEITMNNWQSFYGFGVFVDEVHDKRRIFHAGKIKGFVSFLDRFPEEDICIIVLSNFGNFDYYTVATEVAKMILDS